MDVFQCDAIKLALIDVSDTVIFTALRTAARRLQVVLEPVWGKSVTILHTLVTRRSLIRFFQD